MYYILLVSLLAVTAVISGVIANPVDPDDLVERSVKKDLKVNQTTVEETNKTAISNATEESGVWSKKIGVDVLSFKPEMLQTFYIFLGISFALIGLIIFRMHKLRQHRAERRYGVQGDKEAQELTHLPTAMVEDDSSEIEDEETLFDIHKTRVYVA